MSVAKILRNSVAGTLIALLPVSASVAAVRPNAAVPTASSTAVAAQDDEGFGIAWPALVVIAIAAAIAIWLVIDDDDDGEGRLSRA